MSVPPHRIRIRRRRISTYPHPGRRRSLRPAGPFHGGAEVSAVRQSRHTDVPSSAVAKGIKGRLPRRFRGPPADANSFELLI